MTTAIKERSVKSSFTIKPDLFKRLEWTQNKSRIINEALSLYFEKNDYLEKAEEEFWNEKIRAWLRDVENWDTTPINPNGEKITKEMLNKALWS
jgi:predicted transcriptional regulator